MVLCDTCKHLGNMASWPCEDCLQGDRYERKPTTNADRIHAMTNEELAEWIYQETTNALNLLSFGNGKPSKSFFTWLDWLKQEVEGDG